MYEKLVKRLRDAARWANEGFAIMPSVFFEAADAIEELQQQVEHYHGCMLEWFKEAQEHKAAYIAEHDARITEAKRLYDAFYEGNKKEEEKDERTD